MLQTAFRRSDVIESIHDGSFLLGNWTKLGLFLPAAVVLLFLWVSGMWMVWVQFIGKHRRKKLARRHTKDGNVAIWQFTKGERVRLADGKDHLPLPLNTWHDLEVRVSGRSVTAIVNGKLRLTHELPTPVNGGVGLWTKRDSITAFKEFSWQQR